LKMFDVPQCSEDHVDRVEQDWGIVCNCGIGSNHT
jgi:hypothetical protein